MSAEEETVEWGSLSKTSRAQQTDDTSSAGRPQAEDENHPAGGEQQTRTLAQTTGFSTTMRGPITMMQDDQRRRQQAIRLLQKSLPTRGELHRLRDVDPAQAERLSAFCLEVQRKVGDLELEFAREQHELERQRNEAAKERAQQLFEERTRGVIDRFMHKTLTAEDRLEEQSERRKVEQEMKAAVEMVRLEEAEEERLRQVRDLEERLEGRQRTWHRAVALVDQRREEQRAAASRKGWEEDRRAEQRREAKRREEAEARDVARQRASELDERVEERRRVREARIDERRNALARLQNASMTAGSQRATTAEGERRQRQQAKAAELEERTRRSEEAVAALLEERARRIRNERSTRLSQAQERVRANTAEQVRRAVQAEADLDERLHVHESRAAERLHQVALRAGAAASRKPAGPRSESRHRHHGDEDASRSVMDRMTRVGEKLGVELPPVVPTPVHFITAAPIPPDRPERRSSKRPKSAEPSWKRQRRALERQRDRQRASTALGHAAPQGNAASVPPRSPPLHPTAAAAPQEHARPKNETYSATMLSVLEPLAPAGRSLLRIACHLHQSSRPSGEYGMRTRPSSAAIVASCGNSLTSMELVSSIVSPSSASP